MQIQFILTGLLVGTLVGLTGMGGGSLMTPILVLLLGVRPAVAVGTDLTYAAITKGVVALVLSAVQDKPAAEVAQMDVAHALAPFELSKHLSANRIQGIPNMIALVKETAERLSATDGVSRSR